MDLQLQQIFQRKPNRPFQQSGPPQQFNRPPNTQQRGSLFPPPPPRQQNPPYRGYQQHTQPQGFDQNIPQGRGNNRYQGGQQEFQGGNRRNFNQAYNRNSPNQFQQQNYNNYQPNTYNQQDKFRGQRQSQQRTYQNEEQPRFPKPNQQYNQQNDTYQNRPPRQQQSYNFNQDRSYSPQQNTRVSQGQGGRNQYQKKTQQQVMQNNMSQFFAQQFHGRDGQVRGRGRGRGSRSRQSGPPRVQNQHQRPYDSEMDRSDNQKRFEKFKPQPAPKPLQQKKKSFVKKDKQPQSRSGSQQQSERQYSDEEEYSQSQRSGSYSDYSQEQEQEANEVSNQQQGSQDQQEGQGSQMDQSQQSVSRHQYKREKEESVFESHNNDISTAAINDMCSKQEFNERLATFDYNNREAEHSKLKLDTSRSFSIFEINRRTLKPDYSLALKRFKRSADRAQGQQKQDTKDFRRSVKALVKVMNHINREIIDADNMRQKDLAFPLPPGEPAFEFIHVYDFLWDRMREMIKDITRLSPKQKMTKQIITICEQIARFFILSINEGRKKYNSRLKFDERMNIQSIIKVISDLMNSYRQSRMDLRNIIQNLSDQERQTLSIEEVQKLMQGKGIYLSPYEPQLSAYSFLFSDDRKKEFYQILTVGFQDQQTQSDNPLLNSEQMQKALTVHRILNERNVEKYFEQLQSDDTDYLFACMMLKHLQKMRKQTSQMLFKSHNFYRSDNSSVKSAMLADTLRKTLRFPKSQTEEFNDFIDAMGVKVQGKLLIWRQGGINEDHYIIPQYVFQNQKTNRKDWIDSECKKLIRNPNKLSRQELIKSSWRKSNYREQIISFYLERQLGVKPKVIKKSIPKQIPVRQAQKQTIVQVSKQKQAQQAAIQKQKDAKNLLALNEMRKGLQKKAKRTKFLQKLQSQILELYRHTDQAKIMNRKKGLAIIDEWLMYYQDKMLKISLDMIQNQARKKNLMQSMLTELKTFSSMKKKFNDQYNRTSYEFVSQNYQNIIPQRTEKGLMSGLLSKAQFKAKKISCNSFEQYLNESDHSLYAMNLNFLILTTCSGSSQNQKILFDTILYFLHQKDGNHFMKRKQISQAISVLRSKQKQVAYLRIYFESQNVYLNLRIAKINEVKSRRKAIAQNSHVIQHLFGCHSLILLRDNSRYQATQMVLQNLQEFVSNKSRIYQGTDEDQEKYKIQTLDKIQLPILVLNIWKKSINSDQGKNTNALTKINKDKYPYLVSFNEVVVMEGSTQPLDLPFILRQQLKKHLSFASLYYQTQKSVQFTINPFSSDYNAYYSQNRRSQQQNDNIFCQKSLKQLLREIRVNSSVIEDKLTQKYTDTDLQIKKKYIFCYYQEYFNICLDHIVKEASSCFKNSIFFKKWPKNLLMTQNILSQKDFVKKNSPEGVQLEMNEIQQDDFIANTLESENDYNLILETFKEYEFTKRICEELKMKFVGENIEPIQTKYLIFDEDPINIFGMTKQGTKDQPSHAQKQRILHLTHFINTIGKYLNLFDPKKSFSDDKFQNLYSVFQQYGLQFKTFDIIQAIIQQKVQKQVDKRTLINYQIEGDSLQFFSYLIGYLMDGCKDLNILLPYNFRFKLDIDEFMSKSEKNLNNVLRIMNRKRKDIFDQLKDSQYKNLGQLAIRQLGYEENSSRKIITNRIKNPQNKNVINCDSDIEDQQYPDLSDDESEQNIIKTGQKQSNQTSYINGNYSSVKRTLPCYDNNKSEVFQYCRLDRLNQLKKRIKC